MAVEPVSLWRPFSVVSMWWRRAVAAVHLRTAHLPPTTRAMLWAVAAGSLFSLLNALMRALALAIDPFQAQFLRYFFGLVVLLPIVLHGGFAAYRPRHIGGQFLRGAAHTIGLCLWFMALPKIPLADMTAIGFTGPIFILIGAKLAFNEPMRWERWVATLAGLAGVLIVVGPKLSASAGLYHLVMLASAPVFAASFLITKALTRYETTGTILVWQSISVATLSLPLALLAWQPLSAWQWAGFALSGMLGSAGHYCLTRSFTRADISATQSVKFLDLVWSALLGFVLFADVPSSTTLVGGALICAATVWLARRESHGGSRRDASAA
ncbi:MAG TPA: DMT family transporter [Burkholderiaceae bacterium]|nr:DMT family transporter [Burkholderiaceae bacterium]